MEFNPYIYIDRFWRNWSYKMVTLLLLIIAIVILAWLSISAAFKKNEIVEEKILPRVEVQTLNQISDSLTVAKTAIIRLTNNAPLIARTGGRVTSVRANLGDTVTVGQLVIEIDGGGEGNPLRAQVAGLSESLKVFDTVERAALRAAIGTVEIARINEKSARAGSPLSNEQVVIGREIADLAVKQTALALQDARDLGDDSVVRAADFAAQAGQLAQDQATVAQQLLNQQSVSSLNLAEAGVRSSLAAQAKLISDLRSQRVSLITSLNVARENVLRQQVSAAIGGEVSRLTVKVGDYVSPGQNIGEIVGVSGSSITLNVSTGIREQLAVGRRVPIATSSQSFSGEIVRLASTANSTTGLWQVDITVADSPQRIGNNTSVVVELPLGVINNSSYFVPIDAVTVRQSGVKLFVVGDGDKVREVGVEVLGFDGDQVEVTLDIDGSARVVVTGNRTLRDGDAVTVIIE